MSIKVMHMQATTDDFIRYVEATMQESKDFEPETIETFVGMLRMMQVGFITVRTLTEMAREFGWNDNE